MQVEDTEERYRQHLAQLISRIKSRGGTRYFNQYVNRCRDEAAVTYPKGAAAARKKDMATGVLLEYWPHCFRFLGKVTFNNKILLADKPIITASSWRFYYLSSY